MTRSVGPATPSFYERHSGKIALLAVLFFVLTVISAVGLAKTTDKLFLASKVCMGGGPLGLLCLGLMKRWGGRGDRAFKGPPGGPSIERTILEFTREQLEKLTACRQELIAKRAAMPESDADERHKLLLDICELGKKIERAKKSIQEHTEFLCQQAQQRTTSTTH